MAEEQQWQEQPGARYKLCINNCGFFGSPTTLNLCSKCYKDQSNKEQQMKNAKIAMENTLIQAESSSSSEKLRLKSPINPPIVVIDASPSVKSLMGKEEIKKNGGGAAGSNRCSNCRRRVGLTGFKCKCGYTFCGTHRYPEKHGCTFDYKSTGREAIAKANPVVKAQKLDKI